MQSTNERRQRILETLNVRRSETLQNLANEFGVTVRTIQNDIEVLSCSAPIYTVQGRGGGIRVSERWYISRIYLQKEQEEFLRSLLDRLPSQEQRIVRSILTTFARPRAGR